MAKTKLITPAELKAYKFPDVGETIRYNHVGCPAGADIRRRLYLTVRHDSPSLLLAHCFNCGGGGVLRTSGVSPALTSIKPVTTEDDATHPTHLDRIEGCLREHLIWHYLGGYMDAKHLKACAEVLRYDPHSDRLYIPECVAYFTETTCSTIGGNIEKAYRYTLRKINPLQKGPKYLNVAIKDSKKDPLYHYYADAACLPTGPHYVFIVEDWLSALKIAVTSDGDKSAAHAIGSAYPSHDWLWKLVKFHTRNSNEPNIVVWLDNDNSSVVDSAREIESFLSNVYKRDKVYLVMNYKDPKNFRTKFVAERIRGNPNEHYIGQENEEIK